MRMGETVTIAPAPVEAKQPAAQRPSKAPPKKVSAAEAAAGGTIGELIKQKLGSKLAAMSEKDKKDDETSGKDEAGDEDEKSE